MHGCPDAKHVEQGVIALAGHSLRCVHGLVHEGSCTENRTYAE